MPSPPQIASIYPSQGTKYGYTIIKITGENISTVNAVKFIINGVFVDAHEINVLNDTEMTVASPAYLSLQKEETVETEIVLYNSNGNSTETTTSIFTYTNYPVYVGIQEVLRGTGGFSVTETLPQIELIPLNNIKTYDLTNAIQMIVDVRKFNSLLGLIKDAENNEVIETPLSEAVTKYPNDTITFTSQNVIDGLIYPSQITSVGDLSMIYSDFGEKVNMYFSYGMLPPLINTINYDENNMGVFDKTDLFEIITTQVMNVNGETMNAIIGNIELRNVSNLILALVAHNVYNNRHDVEPLEKCYGIIDGFVDGDLIYVSSGMDIRVDVNIVDAPINYPLYNPTMDINKNICNNCDGAKPISVNTVINEVRVARTVPLLLRLSNLTMDPYQYDPDKRPTLP